jgi:acyl-CoA thioesterase FadM
MVPSVCRGFARSAVHPFDAVESGFTVLPTDLDINLHLNNGRYHQLIDVNRLEWLIRTRILQAALARKWKPMLGGTLIQFRREMTLWQRGSLQTRLLGWDDRWFYLEHVVATGQGKLVAQGLAKAAFRGRSGWVPTALVREAAGYPSLEMNLPARVRSWQSCDALLTGKPEGGNFDHAAISERSGLTMVE